MLTDEELDSLEYGYTCSISRCAQELRSARARIEELERETTLNIEAIALSQRQRAAEELESMAEQIGAVEFADTAQRMLRARASELRARAAELQHGSEGPGGSNNG